MLRSEMEEIIKSLNESRITFEYKESVRHGSYFRLFFNDDEMAELYIADEGALYTYMEFLTDEQRDVEPTYKNQNYVEGPHGGDIDWCYHITQNSKAKGKKTPRNWHKKFTSRDHIVPTLLDMIHVADGDITLIGRYKEALDDSHSYEEKEEHAASISIDDLKKIALKQERHSPKEVTTTIKQKVRDPYIAEYAKKRANGKCQLCGEAAPFMNRDGEPYLESHHIIWLSEGGEDTIKNTVALCPNCHKKMHILNLLEDREKLAAFNR